MELEGKKRGGGLTLKIGGPEGTVNLTAPQRQLACGIVGVWVGGWFGMGSLVVYDGGGGVLSFCGARLLSLALTCEQCDAGSRLYIGVWRMILCATQVRRAVHYAPAVVRRLQIGTVGGKDTERGTDARAGANDRVVECSDSQS